MKNLITSLLILIGFGAAAQPSGGGLKADASYCNVRFGYCIKYPENVLFPQEESANSDGRVFFNKKNETVLTVFGRLNQDENGDPITLAKQYKADLARLQKEATVTYKSLGKDFYVISGKRKGKTFYHKMILKEDAFCFALLEYSDAEKAVFDKYAGVVASTFK